MSQRGLTYLYGLGSILPLAFFVARYRAGGKGSDFWAFWDAGRLAFSDSGIYGGESIFPYPPHSLFLFQPFSVLPFTWGLLLFSLAGAGFFLWASLPYLPKSFPRLFAILSPAALFCLYYGQTGLIIGGLWLLAFRGHWVAVALLSIKPHLGILSLLSLKSWRAFALAATLATFLLAASAFIYGFESWAQFFDRSFDQFDRIGVRPQWKTLGISPALNLGWLPWALFAFGATALLIRKVDCFTAATAALLISPYAFLYDMPVASLGFALALHDRWSELGWGERLTFVAAFLAPVYAFAASWLIPFSLLAALWVQVQREQDAESAGLDPSSAKVSKR